MWTDAENVAFLEAAVKKAAGRKLAHQAPWATFGLQPKPDDQRIVGLAQARVNDKRRTFFGTVDSVWMWEGSDYIKLVDGVRYTLRETTFQPFSAWSFVVWGSFLLATNGVHEPLVWENIVGPAVPLGTPFPTAEIFLKRGPYVIAFNTGKYTLGSQLAGGPNCIHWSGFLDQTQWDVLDPASHSGDLYLEDLEDRIIAAASLAEGIAVYSGDSMHFLREVGYPNYFGVQKALDGIGAVSKHSVVSVGALNYGLGRQGFWKTDGVRVDYISTPALQRWVENNINWAQKSKVVAWHDESNRQVIWYFPDGASEWNSRGLAYNYINDAWAPLSRGLHSAIERNVFDFALTGGENGAVYFEGKGVDDDQAPVECFLRSKPMDLGEGDGYKFVDLCKLRLQEVVGDVSIRLGVQDYIDENPRWGDWQPIGRPMQELFWYLSGRYLVFELRAKGPGSWFEFSGISFYGNVDGGYAL